LAHTPRRLSDGSQCISSQVLELLVDIAQTEGQHDTPYSAALLVGVPVSCAYLLVCIIETLDTHSNAFCFCRSVTCQASLGIPQRRLRPLLRRMQQLVPSASSSPASPRKSGYKSQSLAVIEKLLEGAISLVSQFNPTDAQGDLVAMGVEFWTWVRRRLLFSSATINSIATQQNVSLQSSALLPVTSVLASLLSSIQVQPDFVTGNDSIDILVLLQNLLQSFRTFATAYDSPHTHLPLPLALLFFHSIYTVIESDEDAFRDLQMEEEVQEIGFIRLPQSWLTPDAVHVLPVIARLVAVLGLSMNEAEGLFAASLLHFLKDRCAHSFAYVSLFYVALFSDPVSLLSKVSSHLAQAMRRASTHLLWLP
jgi:hypothetical protein